MQETPALTFALILKRWFRANDWPQKITDDWAKDPGVMSPNGPWASQLCNAMKGDSYNPKADFFLALANFNRFVAEQDLRKVQNSKLKDRLHEAKPLTMDNGQIFGAAELWSLFAGVLDAPEEYNKANQQLTQEDVEEATRLWRDSFREISLKHMCSKAEAWDMLRDRMLEIANSTGTPSNELHDCLSWVQEVLAGIREPTVDEAIRQAKRWKDTQPMQKAIEELLGEKKLTPIA
tara:strand:+ start:363 stop:1067 length:705 start_codon:yes stop_codon:yes gene_type:complete